MGSTEHRWRLAAQWVRIAALAMALVSALPADAASLEKAPVRPKLVVAISVDQFSANLFDEWRGRYTGGLARLSQGVVYSSGYQSHAGTETCPGHSTILTGKHPNKTGIVANNYLDASLGRVVYCVDDPGVVLAHDAKASPVSPRRLMATTLGDWLKAASPSSRVVAVSGKDRAAIMMGGHHADGEFWLVGGVGLTTFVPPGGDAKQALAPVASFNARIADVWKTPPRWTYASDDCRSAAATWTLAGKPWRSKLPPDGWGGSADPAVIGAEVMASPIVDELTGEAARHLIRTYRLGQGPAIDLLAISFSATDFVGHRYGTRGPEMCDQMHRLDATLGLVFADLDRLHVPYLVVLTADHGGSDFVERLASQGYPMARRVSSAAVMARVNAILMGQFGYTTPPLRGTVEEANLVGVADADRPKVIQAAVAALGAQPEIAAAFSREELLATPIHKGAPPDELTLKERFAMSVYEGRSPDILAAPRLLSTLLPARPGEIVAGHGSPWNYDRRVPILFWWPGATPESRFLPIETVDIAPTLAAAMGLTPPADVDGRCLALPPSSGVACSSP
jgi:predicted AlkP superfamily pyrophosphatase or phosphodiesterase